jgi:hypothetical protein
MIPLNHSSLKFLHPLKPIGKKQNKIIVRSKWALHCSCVLVCVSSCGYSLNPPLCVGCGLPLSLCKFSLGISPVLMKKWKIKVEAFLLIRVTIKCLSHSHVFKNLWRNVWSCVYMLVWLWVRCRCFIFICAEQFWTEESNQMYYSWCLRRCEYLEGRSVWLSNARVLARALLQIR